MTHQALLDAMKALHNLSLTLIEGLACARDDATDPHTAGTLEAIEIDIGHVRERAQRAVAQYERLMR